MGWQQWFVWESKAKREARRKAYYNKIYPMGKEQQDWEKSTLKEMFPKQKHIEDFIFELIVLREALINAQLDPEDSDYRSEADGVAKWKSNRLTKYLSDEEKATIMAMAYLELSAASIDELPSIEAIKEKSEEFKTKKEEKG